jgi:hypothetical protein
MESQFLELAYEPFVTVIRRGHFTTPSEGWTAEQVAAHVAMNNDLIASVAESIVAGGEPNYDNSAAVDVAILASYVQRFEDLDELASDIERSARRLAMAAAALDDTTSAHAVAVRIFDAGIVVRDGPIPIGEFIKGNASFHLRIHLEQLNSMLS